MRNFMWISDAAPDAARNFFNDNNEYDDNVKNRVQIMKHKGICKLLDAVYKLPDKFFSGKKRL